MRLLSKCFHQKTQNDKKLVSSIIETKCPKMILNWESLLLLLILLKVFKNASTET